MLSVLPAFVFCHASEYGPHAGDVPGGAFVGNEPGGVAATCSAASVPASRRLTVFVATPASGDSTTTAMGAASTGITSGTAASPGTGAVAIGVVFDLRVPTYATMPATEPSTASTSSIRIHLGSR